MFPATVAGNLILIGSAANLIVAQKAEDEERKRPNAGHPAAGALGLRETKEVFSFARHAKFGIPLTLATTAVGFAILWIEIKWFGWKV